jgi:hypothetical protein
MDARLAVSASSSALRPGGLFVMNDYVGATRARYNAREREYANQVRSILPERFFVHFANAKRRVPRSVDEIPFERAIADDPTECADSEAIIPAIRETFPSAWIWMLGGAVYHLALADILQNFNPDQKRDLVLLESLLILDRALSELGENHYAACIAEKPGP